MLDSCWPLNCVYAIAANERNNWTVKQRWVYATIIDNCSQRLWKESEKKITFKIINRHSAYKIITMRQVEAAMHKNQNIDLKINENTSLVWPNNLTSSRDSSRERLPTQVQLQVPPDKGKIKPRYKMLGKSGTIGPRVNRPKKPPRSSRVDMSPMTPAPVWADIKSMVSGLSPFFT